MHPVLLNIATRRTVKPAAMSGELLSDDDVRQCLEAAHWAPTHARTEPWFFYVYTGDALKSFCNDHAEMYQRATAEDAFNPTKFQSIQNQAEYVSHAVLVVMKRTPMAKIPVLEEYAAVAAATQNMLLAAHALTIATIWSTGGMLLKPEMKAYLNLATEDEVLGCVFMGKAKEEPKEGSRKATAAEKTIWNS